MSQNVYLIRHGIAWDRALADKDETRPLTDKGRKKTKKVAKQIKEVGVNFDVILTSPLLRATQTAEILQEVGLTTTVETFSPLAPDGEIQQWIDWWQAETVQQEKTVALVGHQPDLGNWAETLVWGKAQGKLLVKKAGVMALNCPTQQSPFGASELGLLIPPKWMLN